MPISSIDPSKTITLRKAFAADAKRRLNEATSLLSRMIRHPSYGFLGDLARYRNSVTAQEVQSVIEGKLLGNEWHAKHTMLAYEKGIARSLAQSPKYRNFVTDSFKSLVKSRYADYRQGVVDRAELDLTSAVNEIVAKVQRKIIRLDREELASQGPSLVKEIADDVFNRRILSMANYEVIANFADGQLDAYETLGQNSVKNRAEFTTAGDSKVCPRCRELEGKVYTIAKARGVIPVHPKCRCVWDLAY